MKKIIPLILIILFALSACNNVIVEEDNTVKNTFNIDTKGMNENEYREYRESSQCTPGKMCIIEYIYHSIDDTVYFVKTEENWHEECIECFNILSDMPGYKRISKDSMSITVYDTIVIKSFENAK